jgi:cobalt-zinc-cadmium efflux system membrane fusion protein
MKAVWRGLVPLVLCLFAAGCGKPSTEEVDTETVIPVTTAPAETGDIQAVLHVTGDVNPAPGAELLVVAPEPARIAAIPKAEGDTVRRGDVLVKFDIPTLNADAASKAAEVGAAETRLQTAKDNEARLKDLFDRGVAARKEVEDATKETADAQAALEQARAGAGAARALAARTTITAAFDGVIAKRNHNPGDLVEAGAADPILRVIDPARLQVDASVPIADLPRVKLGAAGRLTAIEGEPPLELKVVSTPAAVEPGTAAAPVRLNFVGPQSLAVGTPVKVDIDAERHTNVVLVPVKAIVREGEDAAVFVVADQKAVRRPVTVGITDAEHAEIRDGLKAGEPVIVEGQNGLPDGASVTLEKPGEATGGADKSGDDKGGDKKPADGK